MNTQHFQFIQVHKVTSSVIVNVKVFGFGMLMMVFSELTCGVVVTIEWDRRV